MEYRIKVFWKADVPDGRAREVLDGIRALGISQVSSVAVSDLYFVRGELSTDDVETLCRELLVDPVVQGVCVLGDGIAVIGAPDDGQGGFAACAIEVGMHPGVTDSVADNLVLGAGRLGIDVQQATTGTRYALWGDVDDETARRIATGLLCNEVIQFYSLGQMEPPFAPPAQPSDVVKVIPIREVDDAELQRMSVERVLFLDLAEMRAIQAYYRGERRDPTDVELETLAQTWSEHCVHKTFKAVIDYRCAGARTARRIPGSGATLSEPDVATERIDGLLKTYLRAATEKIAKPWVRSAFVDNAGILELDGSWDVSFKVETHNHPSALEPFGGANTGVGGVVRDVIGVSARPIANTDVLCFGPQDMPADRVPGGALHPRRIAEGVIAGIEDYGNKMGIPTVNGAILYDPGYTGNPLVFCGCLGIAPRGSHRNRARPGDLCVSVGGRTGRDGLHGATFSSAELTHETGQTVGSVVQIGNPITEKAFLEAIIEARDEELYTAITDCGAGGFSSAVGEMGREVGVEVDLSTAPLKYPGLRPWEIWLSEAQERMILAVPPENLERLRQICAGRDVEITVIGRFTGDRRLTLRYGERLVGLLEMDFLHDGIPRRRLKAVWEGIQAEDDVEPTELVDGDLGETLLALLAWPNIASKEDVVRRYDHEVQGGTVVKPMTGIENDGPSDAAVIRPLDPLLVGGESYRGLAVGCGINPWYGMIDPYAMAWAAVDESLRNVVAVGADPDAIALLDNFCWGNPNLPDRLGGLVRAAQGCHDAALHYGAPFVSGKDSLNNEYIDPSGAKTPIPPTLLISALGFVPDVRQAVTMDLKEGESRIYAVGLTRPELGGSALCVRRGVLGRNVPEPVPESLEAMRALHRAMRKRLVRACHDCSEGGIGVAAAEMALAGAMGLTLRLSELPRTDGVSDDVTALFSETSGRFLVQVAAVDAPEFEAEMAGVVCACVGETGGGALRVFGLDGQVALDVAVGVLKATWQGGVRC